MNERMKKALHAALRPGESVLWESGTQPFGITAGREGRHTLLQWVLSAVCIGAILVILCAQGALTVKAAVILCAILALLIVSPILSYRQLLSQYYFITNERALLLRRDGAVYAMERASMGESRLYPLDFGGAALALGSILLEEKDKQLRWRSNHPNESADESGVTGVRGLVFYHVEHAEDAMRLLRAAAAKEG